MVNVSILVPIYKIPESYLRQCVESCIAQTYRDIEIILVDDGSPDDCGKICGEYALKDSRVKYVRKENGGVSDARNAAIKLSCGKYLYFLDADDWLNADAVEKLVDLIETSGADLVACNHYYNSEDRQWKREPVTGGEVIFTAENMRNLKYDMVSPEYDKRLNGIVTGPTRGVCKMYRSSVIKENDLKFDVKLKIGEDACFNLEFLRYANCVIYSGEYLYHYRVFPKSANRRARADITEVRLALLAAYLDYFQDDNSRDFYLCYKREVLSCIVNCLKKRICNRQFALTYRQRRAEILQLLSDEKIRLCWEQKTDRPFFTFSERALICLAKKKWAFALNFLVKFI